MTVAGCCHWNDLIIACLEFETFFEAQVHRDLAIVRLIHWIEGSQRVFPLEAQWVDSLVVVLLSIRKDQSVGDPHVLIVEIELRKQRYHLVPVLQVHVFASLTKMVLNQIENH